MFRYIDTHTHLYLPEFAEDRKAVFQKAVEAGVSHFFLPAIDSASTQMILDLEQEYPQCHAMVGLHPCSVKENYKEELKIVESWLQQRPFVAIGEIGIDLFWDKSTLALQQEAFRQQCQWALEYDVPIVIHSRDAFDQCADIIEEVNSADAKKLKGIFHCFGGSLAQANRAIALGFYLGIGGVVTYKNAGLAEVLVDVPLENLVLETDAPYLTPVPYRGKRNESAYLPYIATKIAEAKTCSLQQVADITSANALAVFNIKN